MRRPGWPKSAATARSRAISSRDTSRGTTSPITRGCSPARASFCGSASRPGMAGRSAARSRAIPRHVAALVLPGWPVYAAGLEQDDELRQVDGQRIASSDDLEMALRRHKPGDRVEIVFVDRAGASKTATVDARRRSAARVVPVERGGTLTRRAKAFRDGGSGRGSKVVPVPWLQHHRRGAWPRQLRARPSCAAGADRAPGQLDRDRRRRARPSRSRLAGVVVAALKEAFDRDTAGWSSSASRSNRTRARRTARCGSSCCVRPATAKSAGLRLIAGERGRELARDAVSPLVSSAARSARASRSAAAGCCCSARWRARSRRSPASRTRSPARTTVDVGWQSASSWRRRRDRAVADRPRPGGDRLAVLIALTPRVDGD